jgi:drug/metabolite transporter (DMT)-like permease
VGRKALVLTESSGLAQPRIVRTQGKVIFDTIMTPARKAFIQLMIVLLIWASSFAITRTVVKDVPPILFALLRYSVASVVMLCIYYSQRSKIKPPANRMHGQVLIMALTGISLYYIFFNISLVHTEASVGALIQGFIPVVVMVLAYVFLKEKISLYQVFGSAICLAGVILIGFISPGKSGGNNSVLGNVLMIAAVICWAAYTILSKRVADTDGIWLTTRLTVIGTILLLPAVLIEMWHQPPPRISFTGWVAIVYMGIFPSAISYLWYNHALKHISATRVGLFLNLDPVFGAILAVAVLNEPLYTLQIVGGVLVFAGILLSSAGKKGRHPQKQ